MRWSPDWEPGGAKHRGVGGRQPRRKVYTFQLRTGMKWSDGAPFNAEDVASGTRTLLNKQFTPSPQEPFINTDGTPVAFEKIDDTTFKFHFKNPKGLFLQYLATARPLDNAAVRYPSTLPAEIPSQVQFGRIKPRSRQPSQTDWVGMVNKSNFWSNTAVPTINPWVITQGYGRARPPALAPSAIPSTGRWIPQGTSFPTSISAPSMSSRTLRCWSTKTFAGEIDYPGSQSRSPGKQAGALRRTKRAAASSFSRRRRSAPIYRD